LPFYFSFIPLLRDEIVKKIQQLQSLLILLLVALSYPVFGQQVRNFPVDSKLGNLTAVSFSVFTINGQQIPMGAGGQIRGVDNLIILPNMASYTGLVRYQLDISGNLHRVWFLTPDEVKAAERDGQRIPKRFFFF
jgi:hypothetical protein